MLNFNCIYLTPPSFLIANGWDFDEMLNLILKNIINNKHNRGIAIFGGVLMALAPINVIYDGIYWLNPGPVTLLTMIAFYFAIKKKWWQTFFWLALATMTKQNALFFAYPVF